MEKRDVYEILGISKNATPDEIKKAYRSLAKKYHPDINHEPGAEEKFKEVQEAYDILSDEKKKQMYDQFGYAGVDPQAAGGFGGGQGFGGFGGFSGFGADGVDLGDIFSSFFGGGQRTQRNSNAPRQGENRYMRMTIDFMDAVKGKKKDVTVTVDEPCSHCHGTGAKTPNDVQTCPHCNGRGVEYREQNTPFGRIRQEAPCSHCHGTGKIIKERCPDCNGEGYVKRKVTFEVNIPAGIASHQQIRVSGKGERGENGGPNGDLYIEIIVKDSDIFERDGNDVHVQLGISFPEAALGCKKMIQTIYGDCELTIPEGIQSGQLLRMRGKGFKSLRGNTVGDQFVHIEVKTPTKLTQEERELYEKLNDLKKDDNPSIFDKIKNKFKK